MRIGFDAKRYFLNQTGLGNYSRDLIRILTHHYPENEYIKYTPKIKGSRFRSDEFVKNTKLPQGRLNNLFSSFWRSNRIVEDLKRDNIAIFHGLSGEIPVGLKENNIKSVVTIHDLIFLKFPELYKRIDRYIYHKKFKHAVNNADKIVAISQQTKRDIMEFYHIPSDRIEVIYQVCHPSFKDPKTDEQKEELRRKYNLPNRFLLNVGSVEPRKNAFQIVKAIETLDIPLIIVGKTTKYAKKIKAYIAEKGLENRVFLMQGFTMEELSLIYAMADIFIYPSIYEGFGIPIIEALYSGTPVITTNSGVFPEAGGPSSYYIDPNSVTQLTEAIQTILNNPALQQEMIVEGIKYAQRFNDQTIAEAWNNLYAGTVQIR
ncbi:glycosyltransferase family 4 protein [Sphingobacterium paucimobilis]|uniref:Glycosyl transferase family 1 n=1 Tax=Sphingobacterium paucimobilis HER1398 TaxID=1346330 RepID=U2HFW0_9SPHI|nr:glycosyltransferase family 1 protein [Sphingobacterium paucimobilis]ERJ60641.1 hypothetical protein M472_17940 [Sphingobacterium paucimobilis HER1398]